MNRLGILTRSLVLTLGASLSISLSGAEADRPPPDTPGHADGAAMDPLNDDALDAAERREQADLQRARNVNAGDLEFLTGPATANELHTRMTLSLPAQNPAEAWVDMQQCQSGLDAMALSEIVYRYSDLRDLRVTRTSGIESAWVEDQSVQLRGVYADAEICVGAQVKILRRQESGLYRLSSGPYHRRFFDGYFPMRLSLEVRYPAGRLEWRQAAPAPQPGFAVRDTPGRLLIETRFTGMLTVQLDFAATE